MSVFRWIAAEKANHKIKTMCRVLGVSRSGFHAWEYRPPSHRALSDAWLTEKIRVAHADSMGTYGERRIHAELREAQDIRVGRKRVQRLMANDGFGASSPDAFFFCSSSLASDSTKSCSSFKRNDRLFLFWLAKSSAIFTATGLCGGKI